MNNDEERRPTTAQRLLSRADNPPMELVTLFEPSDPDAETHQLTAPPVAARVIRAATQAKRSAVVVVGAGQIVTAIVLRSLGWHVELAKDIVDAGHIAREADATLMFVRIASSHLRSLRRPAVYDVHVVAIVDSAEDTPLPGFDATIAVDDVDALATYVRSIAPTSPTLPGGDAAATEDEGMIRVLDASRARLVSARPRS